MITSEKLPGFASVLSEHNIKLRRRKPDVLQVNVGKLCNLTCVHCHVNAGPRRKEIMSRETIDKILAWLEKTDISTVDLTGGSPEMIPDFRYFINSLRKMERPLRIIDRCNPTILLEPGFEGMGAFLAQNRIEIVASMPCYESANVNAQRGDGVFESSIKALQLLNELGYGVEPELPLNLVYNPVGATLPPDQKALEADYKVEMEKHFGIHFTELYTITNMPIARYLSFLKRSGKLEDYMQLLVEAFNPGAVDGLMCRYTINVGWEGDLFDCDFNQMLQMPMGGRKRRFLWELDWESIGGAPIAVAEHCFGCTAGAGSSCQGTVVD